MRLPSRNISRLAVLHLVASALILWLGYYWLGVAESRTFTLLWSACVAVLMIGLTCWVYAVPLVFFRDEETAWRTALRNLLPSNT